MNQVSQFFFKCLQFRLTLGQLLSRESGLSPAWAPDGRELFFRSVGSLEIMVVPVQTEPTFTPGNPEILFDAPYRFSLPGRGRPWDVAEDGRFLMIKNAGQDDTGDNVPPQINVVLNWDQELLERIPMN